MDGSDIVEAKVYTLYTIKDEETTPEAIRQVELALNRILFHRLGVILKLVMVNEDEYEKLIEDKYAEVEAYRLAKKNNTEEEEEDESSEGSGEVSEDVVTGDDILSMLEHGGEIPLEEPRLDIFLVISVFFVHVYHSIPKRLALCLVVSSRFTKCHGCNNCIFISCVSTD